ncbi:DUF1906 domain-containing protein [Streptomyces sp. NPDC001691]|uniref:DUF1906 domain-containing protein n=1 Tax=unclassified Streptomyces TaxID=2593676 RepID=UPI000DEA84F5|nr:DUF1906 domain-containing protein [Streptomyces sp. SDr-06]RCH66524.1 DUF1906 domain-containing protein [Streptomyces sp. SDr-06]
MRRLRLTLACSVTALLALVTLLAPSAAASPPWEDEQDEQAAAVPTVPFRGAAFDTCNTPSLAAMRGWRSSPYRAVGIYYAGRGRHCAVQRNLNRSWVTQVHEMGWQVLPVFVGSQAPCVYAENKKGVRIGNQPAKQGASEGGQAVQAARALGILTGSALYLDLEAYNVGNASCARTTLEFVRAWNREVRGRGYLPGFYSSAGSGVRQMEQARLAGVRDLPAAIWFARWHTGPALYQEAALRKDGWQHMRIHQYAGDTAESHGGYRLVVDRNQVDAPVARID